MVALYTFTALLALSSSAAALPRPYIFNSKSVQAPAAIKAVASPSASSSVESFWVAAGADYFLPSDLAASAAAAPSIIQDDDTSLPYGRSTPAASPTYPSFPSITPAPTAFTTTNSSATLFAELSSLVSRGLLNPSDLDAQTRSRLSKRDGLNLLDLYLSLLSSRSENGVLPTPWTPAQIRRQSLAEERERSSSSSRAAASSRSAASASAKTTTTTRTYHADGSASRTTTTTRRTSTSTSSAAPAATQTCRVTADCNNIPPANANKYCNDGVCSFRCRTGFVLSSFSGSCMVAPSSSSSSSSTTVSTTTTSRTTTTTTSRTTTTKAVTTSTTTTTAPAATQTCALTADCSNSIPGNANRYCDEGVCGFRCRDGFALSSSGSSCIAEPATTTTTTSAPAPTQTCKVTADCETSPLSLLPANANRYCDEGVCSFRCRSGFLLLGTLCISSTSASASSSPTSTGLSWTQNPSFTTLSEFTSSVVDKSSYSWGGNLIDVVPNGPPAGNWTNGEVVSEGNGPALQVAYPAGSRNPSSAIKGGVGFYSSKLDISQATNVSFSYSVFFPTGFNFVKGGKLPGLFGGKKACSGGSTAEDCFSMRLMFRTGGMGELYLYAPREKQPESLCTLGPLSYCNSVYGMSIGRGSWTFKTGEWTDLRQDIWLNTPGKADGGFNIWVNGQLVLHSSTVYYRNGPAGNVVVGPGNSTELVLIDYDNLPEGVEIPNGGFKQHPNSTTGGDGVFQPSFVTKVILPTPTSTTTSTATGDAEPTSLPWDAELKRARKARRTVALPAAPTPAPGLEKRATTATVASGFVGAMCQTFFGGSDASWNSPVLQYSYFKGFGMRINP